MQGFWKLISNTFSSFNFAAIHISWHWSSSQKYTQEEISWEQKKRQPKKRKCNRQVKTPQKRKLEFVRWLIETRMPMSKKNQVGPTSAIIPTFF